MASIRENTSRGGETTWSVLYRVGKRQPSMTFETRKAAEEVKALMNALGVDRALKALAVDAAQAQLTVDELFEQWIAWKGAVGKGGKPLRVDTLRTVKDYRRDYTNWIQPWLGDRAAELVDEGDVQKLVDHMLERLARKSVLDRHMILHSMYAWGRAKSRRLVTHNPCLETEFPKKVKKPPKGTTVPEFRLILNTATEVKKNPDAADLILFLGETGWRWSEAAALPVDDVDDDGTDVWVTVGQVFRVDEFDRQVLAVDEAKSYAAFRRIRLFPESAVMVRRRLVGKGPGDLVFGNSRGRQWNQNTFLRSTWPGITKAARRCPDHPSGDGMPAACDCGTAVSLYKGPYVSPTPHWLRHMHVAVLAAAGVPIQEIQRRIGHESITTTIGVYGGMIGDMSNEALERSAAIMSGARTAPAIAPADLAVAGELLAGEVVPGEVVEESHSSR